MTTKPADRIPNYQSLISRKTLFLTSLILALVIIG